MVLQDGAGGLWGSGLLLKLLERCWLGVRADSLQPLTALPEGWVLDGLTVGLIPSGDSNHPSQGVSEGPTEVQGCCWGTETLKA